MSRARITLDRDFTIGEVPRRLFGSFVEHMGRCVYTGIFEPGHPEADENGFRQDVLKLVKDLGATVIRYPGGNFVSGYDWEDGIGPREDRPRRLDGAWHTVETNAFGLHEFVDWSRQAGTEIMEAINLGTRGVDAARAIVEYANHPGGTRLSDLRAKNGHKDPFNIKLWCLGNEMDGPWQIGHKTAEEYGRLAQEAAKAMRYVDPDIELVACGSSNSRMPTFGDWEQTVLTQTYNEVDYVSLHAYYHEYEGDAGSFLASAVDTDYFIESVIATADAVRAKGKHKKHINLSFDEWNVWYQKRAESVPPTGDDWPVAPVLLEDRYNVADAVVVGNLLVSLLRNTDRVHAASLAQLVNVIAPIMTEPGGRSWKQTIFHPFAQASEHAVGDVLRVGIEAPTYPTARFGEVPLVDAVATRDPETGAVSLFVVNRSTDGSTGVTVDLSALRHAAGGADVDVVEALTLSNPDHTWAATADDSTSVLPQDNSTAKVVDGVLTVDLPAVSWTMVRLG